MKGWRTFIRVCALASLCAWYVATISLLRANTKLTHKIAALESHRPVIYGRVDFRTGDAILLADKHVYMFPRFCSSEIF